MVSPALERSPHFRGSYGRNRLYLFRGLARAFAGETGIGRNDTPGEVGKPFHLRFDLARAVTMLTLFHWNDPPLVIDPMA